MSNDLSLHIRKVLNSYDIAGIILGDENEDEYDFEAQEINCLLNENLNRAELGEKIHKIFAASFNEKTADNLKDYEKLADEILALSKMVA
jgi:hypothetical protein